jgi:hypothetical protein
VYIFYNVVLLGFCRVRTSVLCTVYYDYFVIWVGFLLFFNGMRMSGIFEYLEGRLLHYFACVGVFNLFGIIDNYINGFGSGYRGPLIIKSMGGCDDGRGY